MNMYEFNKIGYASLPNLTEEDLKKSEAMILNFLKNNPSRYYLMLNNEAHYYTVYTFLMGYAFKKMAKEIIDIVKDLGEIKSIEVTEDGSKIEFWIVYEGECRVFYLFDYSRGVVEV